MINYVLSFVIMFVPLEASMLLIDRVSPSTTLSRKASLKLRFCHIIVTLVMIWDIIPCTSTLDTWCCFHIRYREQIFITFFWISSNISTTILCVCVCVWDCVTQQIVEKEPKKKKKPSQRQKELKQMWKGETNNTKL